MSDITAESAAKRLVDWHLLAAPYVRIFVGTTRTPARLADMPNIRLHLPVALKNNEIRRACTAVEHILRAAEILDTLPPAALEQIRDYCTDWNKGRKGKESEFKAAWIAMVVEHLDDARLRERRLYTGVTGRGDLDKGKH